MTWHEKKLTHSVFMFDTTKKAGFSSFLRGSNTKEKTRSKKSMLDSLLGNTIRRKRKKK